MSATIQVPATLDGANRKKDKSVSVRIVSNFEMSTADFSKIDERLGETGWFVWSSNELQPQDIPDVPADEADGKMTPSQEQRWLLKRLYEATPHDLEWPEYYRSAMRRANRQLRERLEEVQQ